ncbi:hypothetical protein [Chondromyces apiculatus]|uniref:Large repetitive protein n=1 Tax=Chondromyces apiculatus DSM 436 TaxID=1192034 RepID=A0A017TGG8_9BACT|nr:hypothetical protein [Chondromyces apiculatus]EYF07686.1 Large repetitive protein [Chondromyces apiculatus DSM 436]
MLPSVRDTHAAYLAGVLGVAALCAGVLVAPACSGDDPSEEPSGSTSTGAPGVGGAGGSAPGSGGDSPGIGGGLQPGTGGQGGGESCFDTLPTPVGAEAVLAPGVEGLYTAYDLGPVPGVPQARLGGCVIRHDDPNTLLIAAGSETADGAIYSIGVTRGPCGHITGFAGTATLVATTPYVDANLVYGPNDVLFYTAYPVNQISQLLPGASAPAVTTSGYAIGITQGGSVSGFGFVPPELDAAGAPRAITWSNGDWYRMTMSAAGEVFTLANATRQVTLPNGPGGFAYIPAGSPGFSAPGLIVAEWSTNTVGTYDVDAQGDPLPDTRKDFFTTFPRPWGAYFEPATGDFLFLTWGAATDRVYIVQGFAPPPPPPPPPQ